ncbi:MAG TPA: hypothetical protein VFJ16_22260 [Longimicrobium sp.]|nr:hypothetical protein [Longimicrobium sp.]
MELLGSGEAPNVHFEGDENAYYAADGDLFVGGSHVHHDAREDFVRLTFDTLRLSSAPRDAPEMARLLRERGVLVLGGAYDDKPTVARQVAWIFADVQGSAAGPGGTPVLEWNRGTDFPGLLQAIRNRAERAMLLLPGIYPQHVRYDLETLSTAARQAGHHVLVTTDVAAAGWRLNDNETTLWFNLPADGLFGEDQLVSELVHHLSAAAGALGEVLRTAHETDLTTVAGVTLRQLAAILRTPPNVALFVQQLVARAAAGTLDEAAVREIARNAARRDSRVEKWFHGVLSPHEQLLALCLSFFNGLYEDQFFAALERWVAHIRETRDPLVRAFDYHDLDNLRTVFSPVRAGSAGTRFEASAPQRAVLFRAAWGTHRRQIVGAMGVLAQLVAQSPYGRGNDWELYGSRGRRAHLRRVVAEALSDLGLISESAVERPLLRLAADGNAEVQGVAASAVARWRLHGRHEELFGLLDRWQKDARIRAVLESMIDGKEEKARNPHAHIRATVALAVGFAVEYDPPNQLNPQLVALIHSLADDGNAVVRRRFAGVTLPRAVALHLTQLRDLLRDIAGWNLEEEIASAVAYTARTNPAEVAATLAHWHRECDALRRDRVDPRRVTVRETLLRVLAYVYGALDYDAGGPLRAEEGFQRLREMLAHESHPDVRDAVVDAMIRQASGRFEQVERLLQPLMGDVAPGEHDDVVRRLVKVYLDEREQAGPGNGTVTVNERSYPAFVDIARPLTAVERAMMRWMRDPAHPAAQRVAVRALVAFVEALDGPESQQLARLGAERRARAARLAQHQIASTPILGPDLGPGWYTGTFVPWLATFGDATWRPVVAGLLPEVLGQQRARPTAVEFALARWESMRGDAGTATTAQRLRSAISWHGSAWMVLLFGGFAAFMFLLILFSILL